MSSPHTPGPWRTRPDGVIVCPKGGSLATAWPVSLLGIEYPQEANARLIAAAPDLYEALSSLCATLNGNGYATAHADVALAKARAAQGMEAATADETREAGLGPEGDSPVGGTPMRPETPSTSNREDTE